MSAPVIFQPHGDLPWLSCGSAPHSQERKSNGPGLSQGASPGSWWYRAARVHMSLEIQNWEVEMWSPEKGGSLWGDLLISEHSYCDINCWRFLWLFLFPMELNWISPLRYQHGGSVLSPRYSFSVLFRILTDFVIPAFLPLTDPRSCSRLSDSS